MPDLSTAKQQLAILASLREQEQIDLRLVFCKEDAKPLLDLWEIELKELLEQGPDTKEWRMIELDSQMKLTLLEGVLNRLLQKKKEREAIDAFKTGKAATGKTIERLGNN